MIPVQYKSWYQRLGEYFSRKFVLALGALGSGFYLGLMDKDILGYATLAGVVLAFYNGANVLDKLAVVKASKQEPPIALPPGFKEES